MKLKNKKLVLFSIALSGMSMALMASCNSKKELKIQDVKIEKESEQSENIVEETVNTEVIEKETIKKNEIALEYFHTAKTDVIKTFERENVEIYKESIVQMFTYLTDFIFFDYELIGVKFTDLTAENKSDVIVTYVEIDKYINELYPNYKEELGSEYDKVKEFFENLSENNKEEVVTSVIKYVSDVSYSVREKEKVYK